MAYQLTITNSTVKAWPRHPFAVPIPAPDPWFCVVYFDNLGATDGNTDQTAALLEIISGQIEILKMIQPAALSTPFSLIRDGVHLELDLFPHIRLPVIVEIGALQVYHNYVLNNGARDVRSLISCEARACGRFRIWFEDPDESQSHILMHYNSSSITVS